MTQDKYAPGVVGGKSSSLAALGAKVSALGVANLRVPSSLALPFGRAFRLSSFQLHLSASRGLT